MPLRSRQAAASPDNVRSEGESQKRSILERSSRKAPHGQRRAGRFAMVLRTFMTELPAAARAMLFVAPDCP